MPYSLDSPARRRTGAGTIEYVIMIGAMLVLLALALLVVRAIVGIVS